MNADALAETHAATTRRFLAAYAAKDLGAIEALLAPEASSRDWNARVVGRPAVLAEFARNFAAADSLAIDVLHLHATSTSVAAELRIVVNGTIELFVVDVLDFDPQGRVCAIRSYKGIGD